MLNVTEIEVFRPCKYRNKIKSSNYIKLKSREIKAFARDILKIIIKEKEKNTLNLLG